MKMFNLSSLSHLDLESSSSFVTFCSYLGIILAILVIASKNPVVSLLYLIALFVDVAIYLISLNLTYLGLSYITIYVGSIAMLFIFVIMMLNIQIIEKSSNLNLKKQSLPLGLIMAILFICPFYYIMPTEFKSLLNIVDNYNHNISVTWDDKITNPTIIEALGNILYTKYSIWLLVISLIFLLAMIGAITIAAPQQANKIKL
uniref:NADH-ubiquinone oxidoreductase chain 6 n=1 Tax=Pneumocystis canis TaxID=2698477 RepID=A0A8A6W4A4_9ASCO|nr:NADH dehydrogenase subunit 6 [Pneumocystis canis]QTK22342.1 NADH dehydrogenase subunit 6 [Pneumocystis canis]QTK22372.1 NADH dehydrogenase subunit 6 [Pneumocystis canis]